MPAWTERLRTSFQRLIGSQPRFAGRLDDLELLNTDVVYRDGALDYWWSEVREHTPAGDWHGVRVVKLAELIYLPQEARLDAALIRRQAALQRGLIAAGVELITLSFGIFDPPLGVVQCYGIGVRADTLEQAVRRAGPAYTTLLATFAAQFPQSRLAPLSVDRMAWLVQALHEMRTVTTLIGQPDPRESARGGAQERPGTRGAEFSEQQNELLFRAMARAREEFIFLNIATPVARADLARLQANLADLTSPIASRQQGTTAIGFGVSLPVILSVAQGQSAGQAYGTSQTEGQSDSVGVSRGLSQSEGVARSSTWSHTVGQAHTDGLAQTESVTHTSGVTHGVSVSEGQAHSTGVAQTSGEAHTQGSSSSFGVTETTGTSQSHGVTHSQSETAGQSQGTFESGSVGLAMPVSVNAGLKGGIPAETLTASGGVSAGLTPSVGYSAGQSESLSQASTTGMAVSDVTTTSHATSVSQSQSVSEAHTVSQATTRSEGDTVSQGRSESWGTFESTSVGQATTRSQADTRSEAYSVGGGITRSSTESISQSTSAAHGVSRGEGVSLGRTLGALQSTGLGAGVAPSLSVSKSFQWKDENALAITELLEEQLNVLKEAAEEGGLYSDVFLLTRTEHGRQTAEAAGVQAFGGSQGVVTHVQARRPATDAEAHHLHQHARLFMPSTLTETLGWINGYAFSTLITPTQQAAYSAPGLFEEGLALTVQERTPPFAFPPHLPGDVVLGHLYSTERGEQTAARLALTEDRHFHTLFAADTGYGKTVAAERLAVEVVRQWQHRAVILDFGAGWRKLLNGPLPPDRVDLYQLYPGAVRPFRWNFLQIGRRIPPDQQYLATAELLCAAGRMGPRQIGFIRRALRALYLEAGVLEARDADLYEKGDRPRWMPAIDLRPWARVGAGEIGVIDQVRAELGLVGRPRARVDQKLDTLLPAEVQAVRVHRSKKVDVAALYARLEAFKTEFRSERDPSLAALEGVQLRLEPFTRGDLARVYGRGEGSLAVEDLGLLGREPEIADRWGLCVLEGGAELDDYVKVVILSLVAWHLYQDALKRRRETVGLAGRNRPINIFWEEANKLLTGVGDGDAATSSASGAISLWQSMWRDGRKYRIFLHPIVQTLSELPPGIMTSCNNAFFGQLKGLADRDLAVGHLARSERGFTDEEYKRYLSRIPRELVIVKLGYNADITDLESVLVRPLMVQAEEPDDSRIMCLPVVTVDSLGL